MAAPVHRTTLTAFLIQQLIKTVRKPSRLIHVPLNIVVNILHRTTLTAFLIQQLIKTVRKPTRLIHIPLSVIVSILRSAVRKLPRTEFALALQEYLPGRAGVEYCNVLGSTFLQENRPAEAWKYFAKGLAQTKDYVYLRTASACLYVGLGRMQQAIALQVRSDEKRLAIGASRGVPQTELLVLDGFVVAFPRRGFDDEG